MLYVIRVENQIINQVTVNINREESFGVDTANQLRTQRKHVGKNDRRRCRR